MDPPLSKSQRKRRNKKAKEEAAKREGGDAPPVTSPKVDPFGTMSHTETSSTGSRSVSMDLESARTATLRKSPKNRVGAMVARPGVGNLGRQIQVYANVFRMNHNPIVVHQYDVDIQPAAVPQRGGRGRGRGRGRGGRGGRGGRAPPEGPVKIKRDIIELVFKELNGNGKTFPPGASFDGQKNLYVPGTRMDKIRRQVSITVDDKRKSFTVTVTHTASLNLSDLAAYVAKPGAELPATSTAALDVAMRHIAAIQRNVVTLNGAIFKSDNLAQLISPGIQAWAGYTQSVRPCQLGLCLNMNSCFSPMIKQENVVDFIAAFVHKKVGRNVPFAELHRHLDDRDYKKMEAKINKLKAKTVHNKRREVHPKLAGFTPKSSAETYFKQKNGKQVNIVQYMKAENNYPVQYPHLRMVSTYKGDRVSHVAFPPECLMIKGAPYRRKLSEFQKEQLIKAATQKPGDKKTFIEACLKSQLQNKDNQTHMKAWGVDVNPSMEVIPARVLPSPALEGGEQAFIDVKGKGEWDVAAHKFHLPIAIKSWALVTFGMDASSNSKMGTFFSQLIEMLKKRGMDVAEPQRPYKLDRPIKEMHNAKKILAEAAEGAKNKFNAPCQIVMVIMSDLAENKGRGTETTEDLYTEIKVASDQLVGIPSQCIRSTKAGIEGAATGHNRPAYLANLTLKMNAKLGGINSILYNVPGQERTCAYPKLGDRPFMVMGADLTHPPPDSEDKRSVVGVVASMDQTLSQYACRHQFQQENLQTGREVIQDLKKAVKELLTAFFVKNRSVRPEAILFYRDGVSQGEYPKIVQHEYQAIRDACAEMGDPSAEYCPPISFIIVQKRHNMRFLPHNSEDADRSGNILPGTTVDTRVCHPHGFDFYLNSHHGIQGTSRPTLYSVLVDEVGFEPDELQLLTYWMCHLFVRCTKSVSYCPPAYYAHHAAARGKLLLCNQSRNQPNTVHKDVKDSLYFI